MGFWLIIAAATVIGGVALALATRQALTGGRDDTPEENGPGLPTASDSRAGAQFTDWTDAELYSVWCATATELLQALHVEHTTTAAEARQYLLAEIERRHPAETAAWLNSDAILSGEPPHFLTSGDTE